MRKLLSLTAILLLVASCVAYNKMWVGPSSVFDNEEIRENIGKKDVFVHDPAGYHYQVKAPEMNDTVMVGSFVLVDSVEIKEVLNGSEAVKRNEIHIFMRDSLPPSKDVSMLHRDEVKEIAVYELDGNNTTAKNVGVYLIIVLLIAIGVIIWMVNSLANAIEDTADSACYVATMAYGSYDAPEVLTLRQFRDQKLKKYKLGITFIKVYYWLSPKFVKVAKNWPLTNKIIKGILDRFVSYLRKRGMQ